MPEPLSDALVANGVDQYQPERAPSAPQAPYKSFRCAKRLQTVLTAAHDF